MSPSCDSDFDGVKWWGMIWHKSVQDQLHWLLETKRTASLEFWLFLFRLYVGCSHNLPSEIHLTSPDICLCVSGWTDCSEQEEEIWKLQGEWLQQWLWVWWERWSEQWGWLGDVWHHETAQEQGRTWSRTWSLDWSTLFPGNMKNTCPMRNSCLVFGFWLP